MKSAYNEIMGHLQVTSEMRRRALDRVAREDLSLRAGAAGVPALKKHLSAAACLVLLLAGAALLPRVLDRREAEPPPVLAVPNIVEAASLRELSSLVGFEVEEEFSLPFAPEETVYRSYWNEVAQVEYSGGGQSAVFRQSLGTGDNSGDYSAYPDTVEITAGDVPVSLRGSGGSYVLAVWTDGTCAYSLSLPLGASEEEWRGILKFNGGAHGGA